MSAKASVFKSQAARTRVHELYGAYLDSWEPAPERLFVPTQLGETFVLARGPETAPAVVLLHGTMAMAAMWREEIDMLSTHYRVYAVDIIGDAGFSAPVRPSVSSGDHAGWLLEVLNALSVAEAHVVGLSLGGGLALDFASRFPGRVGSLTVITPGGVADKNVLIWALPLLLLGSWGVERVQERILGPAEAHTSEHHERIAELSSAVFQGMKPRTSLTNIDDAAFAALEMPVLVLLGADDVTMDSQKIRRRFERFVPQAEIEIFPGKRHFLGNQAPRIERFLRAAGA